MFVFFFVWEKSNKKPIENPITCGKRKESLRDENSNHVRRKKRITIEKYGRIYSTEINNIFFALIETFMQDFVRKWNIKSIPFIRLWNTKIWKQSTKRNPSIWRRHLNFSFKSTALRYLLPLLSNLRLEMKKTQINLWKKLRTIENY